MKADLLVTHTQLSHQNSPIEIQQLNFNNINVCSQRCFKKQDNPNARSQDFSWGEGGGGRGGTVKVQTSGGFGGMLPRENFRKFGWL